MWIEAHTVYRIAGRMIWHIRMLGRFEVVSANGRTAAFRSRKVGSLLAFLALNRGRETANTTLQDLLWPESDGDRQSQSLRRAVADLRDTLEADGKRRSIVVTDHGRTGIEPNSFETDVDRFDALLSKSDATTDFALGSAEALALYGGQLLAPLDDDWIYAYRRQYEEAYCRAVESLCKHLSERGQGREAIRIANEAIVMAPYREEVYLAAIRGYAAMGNRSMALQQYEALEKMLDDNFGQSPSEVALAAVDDPEVTGFGAKPESIAMERAAGGSVEVESRLYIERDADDQVRAAQEVGESVILVFGPRQVGKTSLLARSAQRLRAEQTHVVVTDFQSLGRSEVDRPVTLYRALIHSFATKLGLTYEPSWNEWIGPNSNLDSQVDSLLRQADGPVVWVMDEVDRLFGLSHADDFFGLIRSWHNRKALDPTGPWRRLSLLISYATEAHLFIRDLNQSPFNVGVRVNLRDFSEGDLIDLGGRYKLSSIEDANVVYSITRGQPYLTRRAFDYLVRGGSTADLERVAASEKGPFAEHLRHLRNVVLRYEATAAEIQRLLTGQPFMDRATVYRLWSAGVIASLDGTQPSFRVPAYEVYLRATLG